MSRKAGMKYAALFALCFAILLGAGCQKAGAPAENAAGAQEQSPAAAVEEGTAGDGGQGFVLAPEAAPFFKPDGLHDEGVEDYDLISSFSIANRAEMIEKREKYSDDSGNTYYFADNELVVYQMPEFGVMHENSEILEKEDCLAAADEALGTMIRDYGSYTITSCNETFGCYKLLMSNGKSELFYDSLTVMVGFDGVIRWLVADYCNLSEVSDEQVKAGDGLLEKYLEERGYEFVSYEYGLRFRVRNGSLLATYIISLKDPDGAYFTDAVSFVL